MRCSQIIVIPTIVEKLPDVIASCLLLLDLFHGSQNHCRSFSQKRFR
jgi:hypothetical protein